MRIYLNDLPDVEVNKIIASGSDIAVDTEAMGLKIHRDRLCLVQICDKDDNTWMIKFDGKDYESKNLVKLFSDDSICKIMHFARFDMRIIFQYLGVKMNNVFCTHIASRVGRTYTDSHSLKDLSRDLLGIQMQKQATCSDWGAPELSKEQKDYAAKDVTYLHKIKSSLIYMLDREGRLDLVYDCFKFLGTRIELDVNGWENIDVFSHHREQGKLY